MCQICNGTHVIHEVSNYSIQFNCCPECGPESDEVWYERINKLKFMVAEMRKGEEVKNG